ncbi:hypothetical protein BH23ACT6_BH23ACT6_09970 [soil metagenome]
MSTDNDNDNDTRDQRASTGRELPPHDGDYHDTGRVDRKTVVKHQKDEHGGMKIGAAFFGWLTATGTVVLLGALLTAIGSAVGFGSDITVNQATNDATANPSTTALIAAITGLIVLLIAYYCGGYVAGRMARFSGLKQGLAVWLWAVLVAVVVAILGYVGDEQFDILARIDSLPQIPILEGQATIGGLIAAATVALVALIGALLGGLAGMRFHRKVDNTGLGQ